jgi:hypothetical protein
MENVMNGQAICKDCGNGTLNNELNPQFGLADNLANESEVAVCLRCGSTHIDGELYMEEVQS